MIYTIRISKKYFYKLVNMCKEYKSYRECIMKELEKKYQIKIYSSTRSHDMNIKNDLIPKVVNVIFYDEENKKLEELSKKLEKTKYEIVMGLFK
ncbi:conserved lipothrixviral protein [Sulfolobus islandicus filamentous virus 2]|uniref:Conserved lipothrixviral protein n=1 Tax=Sulfolobus islandicus filamentous virus 2 TaxID=1902331 RepID=A0A1D8BJ80_SIFV|nr:conserved lipothrixviral protein [Sulfolobus islandicus filamentous virus 2]